VEPVRPGTRTGPVPTNKACLYFFNNSKPAGFTGLPTGFFEPRKPAGGGLVNPGSVSRELKTEAEANDRDSQNQKPKQPTFQRRRGCRRRRSIERRRGRTRLCG
jgi:hypothetical protein